MTAHLPRSDEASPYLTPTEIATMLRLSKMTVYRLMATGELPAVRIGKQFRISRTALDAYLAKATGTAA